MRRIDTVRLTEARSKSRNGIALDLRLRVHWTSGEVAAYCGVTPAAIRHWENGRRTPRGPAGVKYGELLETWEQSLKAAS